MENAQQRGVTSEHSLGKILQNIFHHPAAAGVGSRQNLAKLAGITPETLSRIQSRGTCDFSTLEKLLDALGLELIPVASQRSTHTDQEPRLPGWTQKLGLSFPYEWSNPSISENALIHNVLLKGRFEDIARIVHHFGLQKIQQASQSIERSAQPAVDRALKIIEASIRRTTHAA